MPYIITLFSLFCCFSLHAQSLLLDDFNSGTGCNKLGLYWFYFSDVNDSGNSIIHQATLRNDGSYTGIVTYEHGSPDNHCATLDFTLGDSLPAQYYDAPEFDAFVGIGTDIAKKDAVVDLNEVDSITFQARFIGGYRYIKFEIISTNVPDKNYYGDYLRIKPEWNTYNIDFEFLKLETWGDDYELEECLENAIKLTWQVRAEYQLKHESGVLEIDNVILYGIDYLPDARKTVLTQHSQVKPTLQKQPAEYHQHIPDYFDLSGRLFHKNNKFAVSGVRCRRHALQPTLKTDINSILIMFP